MRIVIVGPPGAGKGTQAAVLSNELGLVHISTGDLFRAHVEDETELGRKVKDYLDSGALVPDEVTNEMVSQRLTEDVCRTGFLLDGFPRTVAQAKALEDLLRGRDCGIDTVLELDAPEDEVVEPLMARGRDDDTEDEQAEHASYEVPGERGLRRCPLHPREEQRRDYDVTGHGSRLPRTEDRSQHRAKR